MAISVTELRPGVTIDLDGQIYTVLEYHHIKMGRGGAIIRTKLKNIKTGSVIEKTFRGGEKVEEAYIERKQMQYLYGTKDEFIFMDQKTFEQVSIPEEKLGEAPKYIKEGFVVSMSFYEGLPVGIDLPTSVKLKVTETGPGFKGDSVSNVMKPATLETGIEVQVPLFINTGDTVKVDTRTGKYIERV